MFFNVSESWMTIGVTGYVIDEVIHLMAWHYSHPSIFDLISIERKNYAYWINRNREKYGKIVFIEVGGIAFNPPKDQDQRARPDDTQPKEKP